MLNFQRIIRTTAMLFGLTGPVLAHADVVNGDFTAGLTGWQTFGDVAALSSSPAGLGLPIHGNTLVLGTATWGADDFPLNDGHYNISGVEAGVAGLPGGLEAFAGVPLGSLDPDPVNHTSYLWEGSAAKQTLTVQAGDTLSFDWRVLSADRDFNDLAMLVIDQPASGPLVHVLGGSSLATQAVPGSSSLLQSGAQSFSHVFSGSGVVTLSWLVADVQAGDQTTFLTVNHVQVTSVPEPSAVLLVLAGLGMVACQGARRRAAA